MAGTFAALVVYGRCKRLNKQPAAAREYHKHTYLFSLAGSEGSSSLTGHAPQHNHHERAGLLLLSRYFGGGAEAWDNEGGAARMAWGGCGPGRRAGAGRAKDVDAGVNMIDQWTAAHGRRSDGLPRGRR